MDWRYVRMFQQAIRGQSLPKYLSTDNDPLYRFHQWQANLRVLEVTEIKTLPYVPLSHPFIQRVIGRFFVPNKLPLLSATRLIRIGTDQCCEDCPSCDR